MKWSNITGVSCLLVALALFIHHFIICGRWLDVGDVTHHEIIELLLIEAGIFFIYLGNYGKIMAGAKKAKNWVFSHPVTVLRYIFFLVGYWQLDVLVANLGLWEQRNKWFYFLRGRLTYWDAYVLFSTMMAIGFFMPDIIKFVRWAWKKYKAFGKRDA